MPSLSFRGFQHRATDNPDGWGIAAFPDNSALIFKEPNHAQSSELAKFVRDYKEIKSQIVIGHVRRMSVGKPLFANTHPFSRELRGRQCVFAHNGTLKNLDKQCSINGRFTPMGTTDSERAFCILLSWMLDDIIQITDFLRIESRLQEMNQLGKMNFLFSDGAHLFAYHDVNGHVGLYYTQRKAPFSHVKLKDEDWEVDLSKEKPSDQYGYVIASKPLTDETWTACEKGRLCVFKNGEIVYGQQPDSSGISP